MERLIKLTDAEWKVLREALLAGAMKDWFTGRSASLQANRDNSNAYFNIENEIEAMCNALREITDAPELHTTPEGQAAGLIRTLCASHHVYGYNTVEFQQNYLTAAKAVRYNWEMLASDMPKPAEQRGRSLS